MKPTLVLLASLTACGGGTSGPGHGDVDAAGSATVDMPDEGVPFTTLIERDWTFISAGDDQWDCRRIQVTTDMWISSFRAKAPLGTLDETLTVSDVTPPSYHQGDFGCAPTIDDTTMLYSAAAGTDDVKFPAPYAVHIKAGQWLNLNIHLVKPGGARSGTSGVEIKLLPETPDLKPIDMMFIGSTQFTITPTGAPEDITAQCTIPRDTTWDVFALWPRMHKYGVHQALDVYHNGSPTVHDPLMDAPFTAMTDTQRFTNHMPPITVSSTQSDRLILTCTFTNSGSGSIGWGEKLADENCLNAFYKYPAGGTMFDCTNKR